MLSYQSKAQSVQWNLSMLKRESLLAPQSTAGSSKFTVSDPCMQRTVASAIAAVLPSTSYM